MKDPRVVNTVTGCRLRFNQALRAVIDCNCAWVDYGISIRPLTIAEAISARSQLAKNREPLPYAEVFGLRFDPPAGKTGPEWQSRLLAYEATLFAENVNGVPA